MLTDIYASWQNILSDEFQKPYFLELMKECFAKMHEYRLT